MEIRTLGAHSQETAATRLTAILVDGVLALDAGALTSTLTYGEIAAEVARELQVDITWGIREDA